MDEIIRLENITKSINNIAKSIGDVRIKLESLWTKTTEKNEVEGYLISFNLDESLLLVKENDRYWKTKWFNNNENIYKSPVTPLNEIFLAK
jgi:hypothetical protein